MTTPIPVPITKEVAILSLGAGVQSTALYLMSMKGEVPLFDYAVFADTGEEPEEVYKHMEWLQSLKGPPILVRSKGKLGDDIIKGTGPTNRFCSIPVFTMNQQGKLAKLKRQCTSEYKLEVIERCIRRDILGMIPRQRIPKHILVHSYIGISLDEKSRSLNIILRATEVKWQKVHFPLIDKGMTRNDCKEWLRNYGVPHAVPKSACTFCPFHTDAAWMRLKQSPKSWARIVEVDRKLRDKGSRCTVGIDGELFLHRSCVPIDQVEFKPKPGNDGSSDFEVECEGMCGN